MKALSIFAAMVVMVLGAAALGQEEKVVDFDSLIQRKGVLYEPDSEKPFTGIAFEYWPNGEKKSKGEYRDGLSFSYESWDRQGNRIEQ